MRDHGEFSTICFSMYMVCFVYVLLYGKTSDVKRVILFVCFCESFPFMHLECSSMQLPSYDIAVSGFVHSIEHIMQDLGEMVLGDAAAGDLVDFLLCWLDHSGTHC